MSKSNNLARLHALVDVWGDATSLDDAFDQIPGMPKTNRARLRLRNQARELIPGAELLPHNPQFSTENERLCPTTLDLAAAHEKAGIVAISYTNNTTLIANMLTALELFCEAKNLQLLIKPVRYHNPNAMREAEPYYWPKRILPYAINDDFHMNSSLVFSGLSLQATTANPLAGKQIAHGRKSVVYGGSSLELLSVATPKGDLPKLLFATGSLNKPKYSNSGAGGKALSRHNNAAIAYIKVGNYNRDYILEWDGTGFSFFKEYWTADGLADVPARWKALHFGDAHAEGMTRAMRTQRMRLVEELDPEYLVWNDFHNHGAGSHHNDLREGLRRQRLGLNCVRTEIMKAVGILNEMGVGRKNLIIRSNHHDHLTQWIDRFKPKQDLANADFYAWLMYKFSQDPSKSFLELAMEDFITVPYEFVNGDKAYKLSGVDVAQHGDKGPDGARSGAGFHTVCEPIQSGHTHKRYIKFRHWTSGVIPLELGYNQGYGTWSSTDTAISVEGTRTHITFIKGKYWKTKA